MNNRERLLRLVRGEDFDEKRHYTIEYSIDIRGRVTIWGGMDWTLEDSIIIDDKEKIVSRILVPLYEYSQSYPYTARICQLEEIQDESLSDETLIEEYWKFRKEHPNDGFGFRFSMVLLCDGINGVKNPTEKEEYRTDREKLWVDRFNQERKDILDLFGVDCPPDVAIPGEHKELIYVSEQKWKDEFLRIGGDLERYWDRPPRHNWSFPMFRYKSEGNRYVRVFP